MQKLGTGGIDQTLNALEQAIKNRKMKMQQARSQAETSPLIPYLFSEIFNRASGSYGPISQALEQGGEFVQNFIKNVHENIQEKPWDVLRKVAVYSFGIGLFLSLRHRKSSTGEKE